MESSIERNDLILELCSSFGIDTSNEVVNLTLSQAVSRIKGKHDRELKRAARSKKIMHKQLLSA